MTTQPIHWPDRQHFVQLIQRPSNFVDRELREATFRRDSLGGPMVWSGGRAIVAKAITKDGTAFAVRFQMSHDPVSRLRYETLTSHRSLHPHLPLVACEWQEEGLSVGDGHVPILKMEWALGASIDVYLDECFADSGAITRLADRWRTECRMLTASGIAHGDLHAENVLIGQRPSAPGTGTAAHEIILQLVDYDSVYVGAQPCPSVEIGHGAYQHPKRSVEDWGPSMDAFPSALIYVSLCAVAADPSLWTRFHQTEGQLILEKSDLDASSNRGVWTALEASSVPDVKRLAGALHSWTRSRPDQYPNLDDFVDDAVGQGPTGKNVWAPRSASPTNQSKLLTWGSSSTPTPPPTNASDPPESAGSAPQVWGSKPGSMPPDVASPAPPPASAHSGTPAWVWILVVVAVLVAIALL